MNTAAMHIFEVMIGDKAYHYILVSHAHFCKMRYRPASRKCLIYEQLNFCVVLDAAKFFLG